MNSHDKFSNLQHTGISWWRYSIRGAAMLCLGVILILLTIFKPDVMLFHARDTSWLPLCGVVVLIIGFLECFDTLIAKESKDFFLNLQNALLDVVVAGLLVFSSGDDPARVSLLIAGFLIIKGAYRIVLSYAIQNTNITFARAGAGVSILLGILIFMQWPTSAAWFLAFCLSAEIALRGLGIITFSMWLHTQQKQEESV
jgi:uncharacterized membrane protein HdeD (DUF308 family)